MTPKTKGEYVAEIKSLIKQASEDEGLSQEEFEELCEEVDDHVEELIYPNDDSNDDDSYDMAQEDFDPEEEDIE